MSIRVQGALAAVLGFPIGGTTIGTHYSEGNKVRLTVSVGSKAEPSEAQLLQVAKLIHTVVGEARPVYVLTLPRAEAEAKYGNAMYNKHVVSRRGAAGALEMTGAGGRQWHAHPQLLISRPKPSSRRRCVCATEMAGHAGA
jgi:hypothetical protein